MGDADEGDEGIRVCEGGAAVGPSHSPSPWSSSLLHTQGTPATHYCRAKRIGRVVREGD